MQLLLSNTLLSQKLGRIMFMMAVKGPPACWSTICCWLSVVAAGEENSIRNAIFRMRMWKELDDIIEALGNKLREEMMKRVCPSPTPHQQVLTVHLVLTVSSRLGRTT